jgi:ATP-dependent helicase YprA (DUF1998 family)
MSIFDLNEAIIDKYGKYVKSFFTFSDEKIEKYVKELILKKKRLWPESLLQLNPNYEKTSTVEKMVTEGKLHSACSDIFMDKGKSIHLFHHQEEAIDLALSDKDFVVTSGTGSGKSLTYFIPIFNKILKAGADAEKVWAIVVYPMNALVNSQFDSLKTIERHYKEKTGQDLPRNIRPIYF